MKSKRPPVRPRLCFSCPCFSFKTGQHECGEVEGEQGILGEAKEEDAVWGELICGKCEEPQVQVLSSPKSMTKEEFAKHVVTHLPYHPACPHCVAGKRCNSHHRSKPQVRKIPLVSADYGFLRDESSQELTTFLVIAVRPWRLYFACVCDIKGPEPHVVQRIAHWFRQIGLSHYAYRSDREPAIRAMLAEATRIAGLHGVHEPKPEEEEDSDDEGAVVVHPQGPSASVPEESSPGESRSNGFAERSIQLVEDQLRCMKLALEDRLGAKIPCGHPIIAWLVEHAAITLTKYHTHEGGETAYQKLHGQACKDRLAEFGETIMYYIPVKLRGKMDPRWRTGIFLGRPWNVNQNYVGLPNGGASREPERSYALSRRRGGSKRGLRS